MSEHEWCQDVPREEAVRAAEDAAAVPAIMHRDLPDEVALLQASLTDILARVVRIEGEIDGFKAEAEEAATAVCDPAFPGEGIRTERVTLEFQIEGSPPTEWPWSYILSRSDAIKMRPGESVRVVDDVQEKRLNDRGELCTARQLGDRCTDLANILLKRDREIGTLKARVAELEQQIKLDDRWAAAAPAANAGGGAKQEPVAWGVLSAGEITQVSLLQWRDSSVSWSQRSGGTVVPLYAAPPEPRGWLNEEEREAINLMSLVCDRAFDAPEANILRSLLARSSPPRVKVPPKHAAWWELLIARDGQWRDAIREAGGEVEG